jgi:3-oxoacyl-[acyl-carrier protein] reductase
MKQKNNKLVIVSGASKGLGLELATKLLESGWNVAGFSRKKNKDINLLNKRFGNKFLFQEIDIKKRNKILAFLKHCSKKYQIFGLINNAGIVYEDLLVNQSQEDIEELIKVNLLSTINITTEVVKFMIIKNEGRIINISSIVASSCYKGTAVYSSTKSALLGFTKSLSRELGKRNITVNSISPGFMKTDLTKNLSKKKTCSNN